MYIPLLKIAAVELEAPLVLAPLANISDSVFRLICRREGAALVFSEMISAEGIVRGIKRTWALTRFLPEERPLGIQLFGSNLETLAQAAQRLEEIEPDIIDLNFGCPVRKVMKSGAGAKFMEDPQRIAEAVASVVRAVKLPVMAKFRSGPTAERITVIEAARRAEAEGAAAVTVHARSTSQGFSGRADWDVIAEVKAAVSIPVIGNGDILTADDMQRMMAQTNCDGVMIGRGALGNPWIFAACRAALNGVPVQPPSPEQIWRVVEDHYRLRLQQQGPRAVYAMRKHLSWYCRGLPGVAEFRARVFRWDNPEDVLAATAEFILQRSAQFAA